jgi:hypothetical protein
LLERDSPRCWLVPRQFHLGLPPVGLLVSLLELGVWCWASPAA